MKQGTEVFRLFLAFLLLGLSLDVFGETKPVEPIGASDFWSTLKEDVPLVLVFFSTECPIARRYVPYLEALSKDERYRDRVQFALVFANQDERKKDVARFASEMKLSGAASVVLDPDAIIANKASASVTPEAVVLERVSDPLHVFYRGKIDDRYFELGKFRPKANVFYLEEALDSALRNQPNLQPENTAVGCYIYNEKRLFRDGGE